MKNPSAPRRNSLGSWRPFVLFTLFVFLLLVCMALIAPAHADENSKSVPILASPIVVSATRTPQPLTDTLADVTVIDHDTLARSGAVGLGDVLARVAGIEMSRTGGSGAATSLFIRGANNEFTAVFLDGVRLDSQNLQGGVNWEAIPLGMIDHIEVLRGPAAAVYGSDAMGGVVQIFSKIGQGPAHPEVAVGLGSYGTFKEQAGISGSSGALDYALNATHERSRGFNQIPSSPPAQNDGYQSDSGHARLGFQINPDQRVEATWWANHLHSAYNDGYGDPQQLLDYQVRTAGLSWLSNWNAFYKTQVRLSETSNAINSAYGAYETDLRSYLWLNDWHVGPHQITLSLDGREDKLISSSSYDPIAGSGVRTTQGMALGYGAHFGQHSLQLNARHDQNSVTGGHNTASAAYGFGFATHWRAAFSAATGFRSPTLYEQYALYGVPTLAPQTNQNAEISLHYEKQSAVLGVVAYRNRVKNLINFGDPGACQSAYGCYANVGRALLEGVTFSAQERLGLFNTHASLDLQNPKDLATGKVLPRRAQVHGVLGADTQWETWTLGGESQASGRRFDDAANTQALGGFTLFNVYASKPLTPDWQLLARVDNLTDKKYELAATYATPGRSLYVGLKWSPR